MMDDQDATFVQGDTQYFDVSVVDGSGNPVDLTNATIEYTLAHKDTTISKSPDSGITVTDAVNGEFEILLDPADTSDIKGVGAHQVEITDGDGDVATVFAGTVSIKSGIQ